MIILRGISVLLVVFLVLCSGCSYVTKVTKNPFGVTISSDAKECVEYEDLGDGRIRVKVDRKSEPIISIGKMPGVEAKIGGD